MRPAFAKNHLGMAGVAAVALGNGNRQRRSFNVVDGHHPAFSLADDFLGNHEHITIFQGGALGRAGIHDLRGQVIPGAHFRQPLDSDSTNFRRHGVLPDVATAFR